jgi:hypothetical protein
MGRVATDISLKTAAAGSGHEGLRRFLTVVQDNNVAISCRMVVSRCRIGFFGQQRCSDFSYYISQMVLARENDGNLIIILQPGPEEVITTVGGVDELKSLLRSSAHDVPEGPALRGLCTDQFGHELELFMIAEALTLLECLSQLHAVVGARFLPHLLCPLRIFG